MGCSVCFSRNVSAGRLLKPRAHSSAGLRLIDLKTRCEQDRYQSFSPGFYQETKRVRKFAAKKIFASNKKFVNSSSTQVLEITSEISEDEDKTLPNTKNSDTPNGHEKKSSSVQVSKRRWSNSNTTEFNSGDPSKSLWVRGHSRLPKQSTTTSRQTTSPDIATPKVEPLDETSSLNFASDENNQASLQPEPRIQANTSRLESVSSTPRERLKRKPGRSNPRRRIRIKTRSGKTILTGDADAQEPGKLTPREKLEMGSKGTYSRRGFQIKQRDGTVTVTGNGVRPQYNKIDIESKLVIPRGYHLRQKKLEKQVRKTSSLADAGLELPSRLQALLERQDTPLDAIESAVEESRHNRELKSRAVFRLICFLGRSFQWERAEAVFWAADRAGNPMDVFTCGAVITALGKGMQWQRAMQVHRAMQERGVRGNVVTYSALITACEKGQQWKEAMKVFFTMRRSGVEANCTTYNALIAACEKQGQDLAALSVFKWMRAAGVEPDTITYSTLISACGKAGQWERAVQVFGWMSMANVKANVVTYSALISACEKGGQWEIALEVFDEMRRAGVQGNETTYNALIMACAKGGQMDLALNVANQMEEVGIRKDTISYSALIAACDHGGHWKEAMFLFEEMLERRVKPNKVTYCLLLEILAKCGKFETAIWIFELGLEHKCLLNYTSLSVKETGDEELAHEFLDFHGLNEIVSRVGLLSYLRQLKKYQSELEEINFNTITLVTGWGKNSETYGTSKIRIAVGKLLEHGFEYPISFFAPSSNKGVYRIRREAILSWLDKFGSPEDIVLTSDVPYEKV